MSRPGENHWHDVKPSFPCRGWEKGVTEAQVPLDRDGHCHENCCCQRDVGERMYDVWEEVSVKVRVGPETQPEGVVDPTENDVHEVEGGQSQQQSVYDVDGMVTKTQFLSSQLVFI